MATTLREKEVPEVLFVCVENAGRSQMAGPHGQVSPREGARALGRLAARGADQRKRGRGDERGGGRHLQGVPEADVR